MDLNEVTPNLARDHNHSQSSLGLALYIPENYLKIKEQAFILYSLIFYANVLVRYIYRPTNHPQLSVIEATKAAGAITMYSYTKLTPRRSETKAHKLSL